MKSEIIARALPGADGAFGFTSKPSPPSKGFTGAASNPSSRRSEANAMPPSPKPLLCKK
jgi:hypothetical protein